MEIWRDIDGYAGKYQVSNLGRVKSLPKRKGRGVGYAIGERILQPSTNSRGYNQVVLCKDGVTKTFAIHKLVATHFIPNLDCLPQVNHKDENKQNNTVDNLEWCTQLYNNTYGTRVQRAKEKQYRKLLVYKNGKYIGVFMGRDAVADVLGVNAQTISNLITHKHKSRGGYAIIQA